MNKLVTIIMVALIVGGSAFYSGMKYAESARQQRMQQFGENAGGARLRQGGGGQGSFVVGAILSKDDKSVTVKLQDARLPDGQGGSKIVFLSGSTKITKSTDGSLSDLEVGKNVSVNGTANSDGSITAQSVQLRTQP